MKKSSVQTFLSLKQNLKTEHEYIHPSKPLYSAQFKTQTSILAHHLMSLWTSKPPEENYHYIRIPHNGHFYHQGVLHEDYYQLPNHFIRTSFRFKDPLHLGKMTLFHLIFAIPTARSHLVMLQKMNADVFYFSLKTKEFWLDFFNPSHPSIHFFSQHSSEEKIEILIDDSHEWWQRNLSGLNVRKLLIKEFFEVYLRLHLTPWSVIEELTIKVLDNHHLSFLEYLKSKLTRLQEEFQDFLTPEEKNSWNNFIRFEAANHVEQFLNDFEDFTSWLGFLQPGKKLGAKAAILEKAFQLNINRKEIFFQANYIKWFRPQTQQMCLKHILTLLQNQWEVCRQQANHPYWDLLNVACMNISPYNYYIQFDPSEFIKQLVFKSILFNHQSIVRFFLRKMPLISSSLNLYEPTHSIHYQRSMLFSVLILKQSEMLSVLKSNAVYLTADDRAALRAHILYCVNQGLADDFLFILKNQYEILYHLDENNVLFRDALENYCSNKNPEFLTLIPKQNIKPLHFFNHGCSSSSSSCSSSDTDSPLTAYKKRNSNDDIQNNNEEVQKEDDDMDLPFAFPYRK